MAPRVRTSSKRQRGESSQQPQGPPRGAAFQLFHTPEALERYHKWISTREIKKERGIELDVPAGWNWGPRLLAQPGDAFCSLVREFYANAGDGVETNTSIVRGVRVDFSSEAINGYYGTTDFEGDDYYHSDLRLSELTEETWTEIATSFHPEARWNIRNGMRAHINYEFFSPQDRGILDFIKARLIPSAHRGNVRRDQVFLTYCIKERQTIDVGVIINQSIREVALSDEKSRCYISHPFLITELCRLAGVPIIENQEVKLKPQQFITPHYVETRYGQGQLLIDEQDEQDVEPQGDDDAMGGAENVPQPAAPAPAQVPPQYDMAQFFARQEEFMKRQEDYMRRGNEVHWFVGTSMYQHNQAAQGFTPTFPPPPPWLQDPQFIPDYYTPHFPPPPPDGDHQ